MYERLHKDAGGGDAGNTHAQRVSNLVHAKVVEASDGCCLMVPSFSRIPEVFCRRMFCVCPECFSSPQTTPKNNASDNTPGGELFSNFARKIKCMCVHFSIPVSKDADVKELYQLALPGLVYSATILNYPSKLSSLASPQKRRGQY